MYTLVVPIKRLHVLAERSRGGGLVPELPASTSAIDAISVMEVCLSSSPSWRDDSARRQPSCK